MPPETPAEAAPPAARTDVLVVMTLDVKLTADQLAALSDEQTTQLFKAIKTIASLTDLARTNAVSRRA